MRDYLNPASMVLFPAAKVSFNFLLQATDNYFPSLDRIKFKAAGCLSFLCLPLGVFSFHCYKLKMVIGLFVYQHLFSSRETKFQINLLRTHPRFPAATWPLVLPQVPRYPLGRDCSVTPPLSVERGNSELLPRHQQSSVRCLTILVPLGRLTKNTCKRRGVLALPFNVHRPVGIR